MVSSRTTGSVLRFYLGTGLCPCVHRRAQTGRPRSKPTLSGPATNAPIPLPEGANLIERIAGDPANGVDPRERYEIQATSEQITSFYGVEMKKAGWQMDPAARPNSRFYEKGNSVLGVMTNNDGGSFHPDGILKRPSRATSARPLPMWRASSPGRLRRIHSRAHDGPRCRPSLSSSPRCADLYCSRRMLREDPETATSD